MMDTKAANQEEKDSRKREETLRETMEFVLYARANDFVEKEIIENEYRISRTRLENLSRAFQVSFLAFDKIMNSYLARLAREAEEVSAIRALSIKREIEILKKIRAQCSMDILKGIPLGIEESSSRSERKRHANLKGEYAGRLAYAWFTHFVSAYVYKVRLKEASHEAIASDKNF